MSYHERIPQLASRLGTVLSTTAAASEASEGISSHLCPQLLSALPSDICPPFLSRSGDGKLSQSVVGCQCQAQRDQCDRTKYMTLER